MAAYPRVYDSSHLQADCQEPGSDPEAHARQSSMGYLYLFLLSVCVRACACSESVHRDDGGRGGVFTDRRLPDGGRDR